MNRWAVLFVVSCLLAVAPAHSGETEFGIVSGLVLPDEPLLGGNQQHLEPEVGLRGGIVFGRYGWFIDGTYARLGIDAGTSIDYINGRTAFEFFFKPHTEPRQFFVSLGGGYHEFEQGPSKADGEFLAVGIGQRLRPGNRTRVRWELRVDRSVSMDGLGMEEKLTMAHGMVAITWGLGVKRKDTDGDGVYDNEDACPGTPPGVRVDATGCPLDTDGDGVFDGLDRCPSTPSGWPVDGSGCPLDSDGDGVADGEDRCPDTPRGATVDPRGCPRDGDEDGVLDGIDRCPGTPPGARVDARGCPTDSDGDGVFDGIDKCPNTPAGTRVDADGCAIPEAPAPLFVEGDDTPLVLEGVFFEFDSAKLTLSSRQVLDLVAESLVHWKDVRVEIGGHTDSVGSAAYNRKLSRERAESVRQYLISKGVAPNRMVAEGYGESRPIADESRPDGAARNRRVELTRID